MFPWISQPRSTNVAVAAGKKWLLHYHLRIGNLLLMVKPYHFLHQLEIGALNVSRIISFETMQ